MVLNKKPKQIQETERMTTNEEKNEINLPNCNTMHTGTESEFLCGRII